MTMKGYPEAAWEVEVPHAMHRERVREIEREEARRHTDTQNKPTDRRSVSS